MTLLVCLRCHSCSHQRNRSIMRSEMEYVTSVWMAASIRLVGRLNIVQRTVKSIAIPETYLSRDDIQPPAQRRQIGALTFFHRIYYVYAPTVSNSMLPPTPIVRKAIGAPSHHTAAVANQHRNKHISLSC